MLLNFFVIIATLAVWAITFEEVTNVRSQLHAWSWLVIAACVQVFCIYWFMGLS